VGKIIGFLAALIAVIAGVGSALGWLGKHVDSSAIVVSGLLVATVTAMTFYDLVEQRPSGRPRWFVPTSFGVAFGVGVLGAVAEDIGRGALYVYVALVAAPGFWAAYKLDQQRYKECPDCCESVKANARVCRHCRYEFFRASDRPKDATLAKATQRRSTG
jgi:uncharacterized membrane protein YfcA